MKRDGATERVHQRHTSNCWVNAAHTMALAAVEEEAADAAAAAARDGTSACPASSLEDSDDPPAAVAATSTVGSGLPSKPVVRS